VKQTLLSLVILFLAVAPAAAQKVYIDYDRDADFDSYKTFAWHDTSEVSLKDSSPLMDSRIKNAIEYRLTRGGMVEDNKNPDIYVTYYTEEKEEVRVHTTSFGYGYGGGWYNDPFWGGSMGSSTSQVYTYPVGTLIIDLWDAKSKQAVWRGTATGTIPAKPEKQARMIDNMVEKMANKWQKMQRKAGR
jgi:hypothetical protein